MPMPQRPSPIMTVFEIPLLQHLPDVPVQPHALELFGGHVAGAGDAAAARGRGAETLEGLRHAPFGARVEEC